MEEIQLQKLKFIGKPYAPTMIDENGSFLTAYQELENLAEFTALDESNQFNQNRAYLVIFGPENFMFWQGMIYENDQDITVPKGLFTYDLPESKAVEDQRPGNEMIFNFPVSLSLQTLLTDIKKAGLKVPANLGLSENPYLIMGLDLEKQEQFSIIYQGEEIADVND